MNDKLIRKNKKLEDDISILELKQKRQAYLKLLNGGKFSKKIIQFCIIFTAIFAIACLYVQYKTGYETHSLLAIVATVFGGELLMLLFKRIWDTDDNKILTFIKNFKIKRKKEKINDISSDEKENKEMEGLNND